MGRSLQLLLQAEQRHQRVAGNNTGEDAAPGAASSLQHRERQPRQPGEGNGSGEVLADDAASCNTGSCNRNSGQRANGSGEVATASAGSSRSTKIGVVALKNKKLFKLSLTPIEPFGYYPGPVQAISGIA